MVAPFAKDQVVECSNLDSSRRLCQVVNVTFSQEKLMSEQANSHNRLNVSLSGEGISTEAEELRSLLEKRLAQRLSMAQVFKRLMREALNKERSV